MGIGYMALWGFGAKCRTGLDEVDTPKTVITARAPVQQKPSWTKSSADAFERKFGQLPWVQKPQGSRWTFVFCKIKLHPCTGLHWIALACNSHFVCLSAACVLIENQLVGCNTWKSVGEKCCFNHQYLVSVDGCSTVQGASSIEPSSTIIKSTMTMINTSIV